jgi:hypothetical protein
MKPLLVVLLVAGSLHAQSLADAARKERERQSKAKPTVVVTAMGTANTEEEKPAPPAADQAKAPEAKAPEAKEAPKPQVPAATDPLQLWNAQMEQARARVRALQDQETQLLLQLNQANNLVYAPVTDPGLQQRALTQVGDIQQKLLAVRKDLDNARKALDALQLQAPIKK